MLDPKELRSKLPVGNLGEPLYFFTQIGSTNDYARELAAAHAPHGTLVLADEQTAGRGRWNRSWSTPPGSALAMSLLLRPPTTTQALAAFSALGALAVAEALDSWDAGARIKWPNDVLLTGRKAAGVLVELEWQGAELAAAVLGIGLNVNQGSAPPDSAVRFPATSLEESVGKAVDRQDVLLAVLQALDRWWERLGSEALRRGWQARLAYRGERVILEGREDQAEGRLVGIARDGRLRLELPDGSVRELGDDFVSLRPVDMPPG